MGWGAAVLPPDPCDIKDWPITVANLAEYERRHVLAELCFGSLNERGQLSSAKHLRVVVRHLWWVQPQPTAGKTQHARTRRHARYVGPLVMGAST